MRRRLPALLGTSLLLAGCAAGEPDPVTGAVTDTTTSADASAVAGTAPELPLGEWAPADCPTEQPCDVEFRIADILIADTCEFGRKPGAEPLPDDNWVLTIYTEARSGLTADGKAHIFSTPEVVDEAGEVQPATYDQPCADNPEHADFEYLLTGIEENSESQFADMLAVPAGAAALLFEGRRIDLPDSGAEPTASGEAGVRPDTGSGGGAAGLPTGESVAPHQVGRCEADGRAMFSDGIRRPAAACPNDSGGGAAGGGAGDGAQEDPAYRCADTGEQVADPSDCLSTPPDTQQPSPTTPPTSTTTPTPTVSHPNPSSFDSDYEEQLWHDCANDVVQDKLLCDTMYELYGEP